MAQWNRGYLMGVGLALTIQAPAQSTTVLFDLQNMAQPDSYIDRVQLLEMVPGEDLAEAKLRFSGSFSSIGQRFTTARSWTELKGISCIIKNNNAFPISLGYAIEVNPQYTGGVRAGFDLRPGESRPVYVDLLGRPSTGNGFANPLPILAPSYRHVYPWQNAALNQVFRWTLYLRTNCTADISVSGFKGYTTVPAPVGIFDRFGQYTNGTWPGKVTSSAQLIQQRQDEDADLAANPGPGELTGSTRWAPTANRGKWRTYRPSNGKTYFISPEGRYFWSFGIVSANPEHSTMVEGREDMFQDLPTVSDPRSAFYGTISTANGVKKTYSHYLSNLSEKYGEQYMSEWKSRTSRRLQSWGFNTLGTGFDASVREQSQMPFVCFGHTTDFAVRVPKLGIGGSVADPFSSTFQANLTNELTNQTRYSAGSDRLLGLYVDGETLWGYRDGTNRDKYAISLGTLTGAATLPAKVAFVAQLTTKYGSIGSLNASWQTSFASWASLKTTATALTDNQVNLAQPDLSAFLYKYACTFFAKSRNAVRAVAPNALYLGGREDIRYCPEEILLAAQAYCDVISFDIYDDPSNIPWARFASLQKPVLLSEFSYLGREGGAFPAVNNPYIESSTQAERAQEAQQLFTVAVSQKNIIGVHWWRYIDEPTSGKASNGSNWHLGVVSGTDRPYQEMVTAFRSFSESMYQRRGL